MNTTMIHRFFMLTLLTVLSITTLHASFQPAEARERGNQDKAKKPVKSKTKAKPSDTRAARDQAIKRGLTYLYKTVPSLPDASGTPSKQFTMAVMGLVKLLGSDLHSTISTPSRRSKSSRLTVDSIRKYLDKYGDSVARDLKDDALIPSRHGVASSKHVMQYTWPLAMAAVFFAECHAREKGVKGATSSISKIAAILAHAQAKNGGWGHGIARELGKPRGPNPMDGFGLYPNTLVSTSNLVAPAMVLAERIGGRKLDKKKRDGDTEEDPGEDEEATSPVERALAYLRYAELSNGNFPYDPSQRASHKALTGVSRAAGSAWAMHMLGVNWRDVGMRRALGYIDQHFEYLSEGHGSSVYNLMLAAFLQRARGPVAWQRFKDKYFPEIIQAQDQNGVFRCICKMKAFGSTNDSERGGGENSPFQSTKNCYVTSIHTLILLLDVATLRLTKGMEPESKHVVTKR